jgi:hypothetical protein
LCRGVARDPPLPGSLQDSCAILAGSLREPRGFPRGFLSANSFQLFPADGTLAGQPYTHNSFPLRQNTTLRYSSNSFPGPNSFQLFPAVSRSPERDAPALRQRSRKDSARIPQGSRKDPPGQGPAMPPWASKQLWLAARHATPTRPPWSRGGRKAQMEMPGLGHPGDVGIDTLFGEWVFLLLVPRCDVYTVSFGCRS